MLRGIKKLSNATREEILKRLKKEFPIIDVLYKTRANVT